MCQIIKGNAFAVFAACDDRDIPHARLRDIGHIQHQLIHAHPPDDRRPPAMQQHLGAVAEGTGIAVGIADGYGGDAAGGRGGVHPSVAYRGTGGDLLDHGNDGIKRHGRADIQKILHAGVRIQAVLRKPQPAHIQMVGGVQQRTGGIAAVPQPHIDACRLQAVAHLHKQRELPLGKVPAHLGILIGNGKVGKDAGEVQAAALRQPLH